MRKYFVNNLKTKPSETLEMNTKQNFFASILLI